MKLIQMTIATVLSGLLLAPAGRVAAQAPGGAELLGSAAARQKLTEGKIAEDLGKHEDARALFAALVADDATPRDVACEALVRQAAVTWQHVNASEGIALLKLSRDRCAFDKEAMRLLVSVVTGVEQDPETWRGRSEDFIVAVMDSPSGPEPMIAFLDDAGRDPFSVSLAQTPTGGRAWRGKPVSLSVENAPLGDVFRLLHEVSGTNIVVDPIIKTKTITLDVVDVPWDQLLDLILRTQGLAASQSGNITRIAPIQKLAAERFAGSPDDLERQRETMESLREVALAIAERRGTAGAWPLSPQVMAIATLEQATGFFPRDVPSLDAWGNDLKLWSDGKLLRIVSPGSDGLLEHADLAGYLPTVARHPQDDLVWQDTAPLTTILGSP